MLDRCRANGHAVPHLAPGAPDWLVQLLATRPRVWHFDAAAGWSLRPDLIPWPDDDVFDADDRLHEAGFYQVDAWGNPDTLGVELWARCRDDSWRVRVWAGASGYDVLVGDLPGLVELLGRLMPMVEASAALSDRDEARRQKCRQWDRQRAERSRAGPGGKR
jgi:hypothetical protein